MEALQFFVNHLLEANFTENEPTKPKESPTSVATKILRFQTDTKEVLAQFRLPINPVLDMLLDLFINEQRGRKVSITDVAIAGLCLPTTGLRWVGVLTDAGLVQMTSDVLDHRRSFVSLTVQGRQVALQCIAACTIN